MRRIISILLTFLPALGLYAQSMFIYKGSVVTMANAEDIENMTFNDSTTFVINGIEFAVDEIDSIVVGNETFQTDSIIVKYSQTSAKVFVPLNIAKHQAVEVNGAHVRVISSLTDVSPDTVEVKYALSGSTLKGSFYQEGAYKCTLVLNGVSITSNNGPAIHMYNGKRIDVIVADGTTNTLKDQALGEHRACMAIKGHAEFKGGGTLNIIGQTYHAYKSNEYTIMKKTFTGNFNVKSSLRDGMHVGQYFQLNNGNITIEGVKSDGIQVETTTNPLDELNGQMILNDGNIDITANGDTISCMKCDGLLTITGGTYNIKANGLGSRGIKTYQADISSKTSNMTLNITAAGNRFIESDGSKTKSVAFKCGNNMWFRSGTINITATGEKAHGIDVGNNYYYSLTKAKSNVQPNVDGMMYILSE